VRRIRPVRVALQNQRDDLLAFAGVLDEKLAAHKIGEDLVREAWVLHRLPGTATAYWLDWNRLRAKMGGKFHTLFDAVSQAAAVSERSERTAQGYRRFRCRTCSKQFNERSTGLLNRTQYPSDVIALVVLWRLRYKLSLRDLAEMFLIRGIEFSYEAVRDWEAKLTPTMVEALRRRRRGKIGRSWYVDETYVKVQGRWCYLYRAIDTSGALVDVRLSETRDMAAAKAFFQSAKTVTGITPARVTTDGHDSYPRAIRTELGEAVRHRPTDISTTGSSRIIAASRVDISRCAGSRTARPLRASVEASTN
jgi:putative transposase